MINNYTGVKIAKSPEEKLLFRSNAESLFLNVLKTMKKSRPYFSKKASLKTRLASEELLPELDSNQHKQNQNLLSCH